MIYISASTIKNAIEYFRTREYSKPEQIGLFLYFKAAGINGFGYADYKKWGEYEANEREALLRNLYDLAGIFDETTENGQKYTALFPFSISRYYKPTSYYNGGSVFKTLGSRISDTLDNALIGTIIVRDSENKNHLKFADDYLSVLKTKHLKGQRISLAKIAAWVYRFWYVDLPEGMFVDHFRDALILKFLQQYNISLAEYKELFSFDNMEFDASGEKIEATELRNLLGVRNGDCVPDIQDGNPMEYMQVLKGISKEEAHNLLDTIDGELTEQKIEALLAEWDAERKKKSDWESKTELERAIIKCWEDKAFNYAEVDSLYEEFNERYGKAAIAALDGVEVLNRLFGRKDDNSLVYCLEHVSKYNYFGKIGGFRTIYTLYEKDGEWHYCTNGKNVKVISEAEAIEKAIEYRDGFVALFDAIDEKIATHDFEDISGFAALRNLVATKLGNTLYNRNWVWKYLHMIYPNLFMNVYSSYWVNKVFRVAKMIPESNYSLQCGQFSLFAKKLGLKNVYLYHILCALDDAEEPDENDGADQMDEIIVDGAKDTGLPIRTKRVNKKHSLNRILYGAPGTGKTYATAEYAMAIIEKRDVDYRQKSDDERADLMRRYNAKISDGQIVFTTFHQSYGYEDFIQGLRPDNDSEQLRFVPYDGVFKRVADKAIRDLTNDYVIIIDEINRANISKVFGELITLIEEDKRWGELNAISVTLPSGERFAVPNNLYIIGTMNSADKSISLIDTALRRRFEFIEVTPNYATIADQGLRTVLEKLNKGLVDELDSTDLLIGHSYFIGRTIGDLCEIMNRSIIPLLYEYFYDNAKKVKDQVKKAIDGFPYEVEDTKIGRIKLIKKD